MSDYLGEGEQLVPVSKFRKWAVRGFWCLLFALFFMFLGAYALSLYSQEGGRF
jgi:hypothetical protein